MVGRARTVSLRGDFFPVIRALADAEPGEVLVIDPNIDFHQSRHPATGGMVGELLALEAIRKGIAGFVIDGFCRDVSTLRSLGIPIWCRGTKS